MDLTPCKHDTTITPGTNNTATDVQADLIDFHTPIAGSENPLFEDTDDRKLYETPKEGATQYPSRDGSSDDSPTVSPNPPVPCSQKMIHMIKKLVMLMQQVEYLLI